MPPSRMPKIETIRKHFPKCKLPDSKLLELAEWLKGYSGKQNITPTNKIFKVLIAREEYKQGGK